MLFSVLLFVGCGEADCPKGPTEDRECNDGCDNDRDGLIDKDDPDCDCPFPLATEEGNCDDGCDNDLDNRIDEDDPDCETDP